MSNKDTKPFVFPENRSGIMCAVAKEQSEIPADFPVTKCKPSKRGMNNKVVSRPRKAGRIISWDIAEALAPDAALSYEEQIANEPRDLRSLSPKEAAQLEMLEEISKLRKENAKMKS